MARRFLAITVFSLVLIAAHSAVASDFTEHFVFTKPPVAMPQFTFKDGKGQELDLKSFHGRYVLLNLWATWCGPCTHEMPALNNLAGKLAADSAPAPTKPVTISLKADISSPRMEIVALTEDHDGLTAATNFYRNYKLSHLGIYIDDTGMGPSIFHIRGLPTTFLIDPNGMEIGHIEGQTDWDNPETVAFLEAQMKPVTK